MKYRVRRTNRFEHELKIAIRRGYDTTHLDKIVKKLANGEKLPIRNRDHALTGNYEGFRECHIGTDWLLVYRIEDDVLVLTLSRTGSHSDLF
jgi:mRNA interferase YafQ